MTTPEARPAAPLVDASRRALAPDEVAQLAPAGSSKVRLRLGYGFERALALTPGQLWQREAARDVERHGEPLSKFHDWPHHLANPPLVGYGPERARRQIAEQIERRRPAMRATRAELEALSGREARYSSGELDDLARVLKPSRRLEPEPSSMARTGLALGLAFCPGIAASPTSDDAKA